MKGPVIISIISKRCNTGKTTLISGLIPILKAKGYKVMTVKYSCYDFEIDQEDKDSYKHYNSGADRTMIVGPAKRVLIERSEERMSIESILKEQWDVDVILTEGYRGINFPTIEVIREARGKEIYTERRNLVAIASDVNTLKGFAPVFDINDYEGICHFIEINYLTIKKINSVS
jgi:molybdopterin-guanine dinucleotide biosynthesis adapter protein